MVTPASPDADTPRVSPAWAALGAVERVTRCQGCIDPYGPNWASVVVTDAHGDGRVILNMRPGLTAQARGIIMRGVEARFKRDVDPAIQVFLRPSADRNALRRLRGVSG